MNTLRLVAVATCALQLALAPTARADVVTDWNQTAMQAAEAARLPPPPHTRVMAMVHAAIYDAVNAIDRRHIVYAVDVKAMSSASIEAAAAAAANGILTRVFPAQQMTLDAALAASLAQVADGDAKVQGVAIGREVAAKIFEMRKDDGANQKAQYSISSGPGVYQLTPPMNAQPVLPHWRSVRPFFLKSASQFAMEGPPAPNSAAFAADLDEVLQIGGRNSTKRTNEQTATALFWAVSEVPPLNALARRGAAEKNLSVADNARLFAYLNMAMADALIAGFEAKYKYNHWRPMTAIRAPKLTGAQSAAADSSWEPMLVTPPHPEYPSAHCLATGAAAQVLVAFLGTDKIQIALTQPIPLGVHRSFTTVSQIVKEMEDSRVWGGIHFRTANEHGTRLGRQVGEYGMQTYLQPVGTVAAIE
ncbi:MAG: vanadium-dependent haloperoxidase [Burkholderiaceae bacterium]